MFQINIKHYDQPVYNFERVSETQFLIQISDINSVNHVVVFMTGEMPFPEGFAGAGIFKI